MEEVKEILKRLTTIEVSSEEYRISHKEYSKLVWKTINEKLDLLLSDRDSTVTLKEKVKHNRWLIAAVFVGILGLFWRIILLG